MCISDLQILGTAFNHYLVMKYIDPWCGRYVCGINKLLGPNLCFTKGRLTSVTTKRETVNGHHMQLWASTSVKVRFFQLTFSKTLKKKIRILQCIIIRKNMVESPSIPKVSIMVHCTNYFLIFQRPQLYLRTCI